MSEELTTTLFQHKAKAEQIFAGAVFISPDLQRELSGWLQPELIHDEKIAAFWRAVRGGEDAQKAAIDAGIYVDVIGYSTDAFTSASGAYAKTIAEDAYLLSVVEKLPRLAQTAIDRDMSGVTSMIAELGKESPLSETRVESTLDIALKFSELIYDPPMSIPTGIIPLNRAVGGFERQELTLLAARPRIGKSAMAFQFARNLAAMKYKVLYFSIEMNKFQLWARVACGGARVAWRDILSKSASKDDLDRVSDMSSQLMSVYEDRLLVHDSSRTTLGDIWELTAAYRPDMIIVDHLGLVSGKARGQTEIDWLGDVSWTAKQIAREFNCVSLLLSQLNRAPEKENRRPILSDLRDSGELEQNAGNVLFIHRDNVDEDVNGYSPTELIIAKFRNGMSASCVNLQFDLPGQWFYTKDEIIALQNGARIKDYTR